MTNATAERHRRETGRLAAAALAYALHPSAGPPDTIVDRLITLSNGDELALRRAWRALCRGPSGDESPDRRAGTVLHMAAARIARQQELVAIEDGGCSRRSSSN